MHPNCYNLLMRHCPDTVVHQAIRAGGMCWDDLQVLVKAKINALTLKDDESGMLPFMIAAAVDGRRHGGSACLVLSTSYELLSMDPSVLQDYISY